MDATITICVCRDCLVTGVKKSEWFNKHEAEGHE